MRVVLLLLLLGSCNAKLLSQIFEPLGDGLSLSGSVFDIAFDDTSNAMAVIGDFSGIDRVKSDKVVIRENDQWVSVPTGEEIRGDIYCAEYHNGELYIGGSFTIERVDDPIVNVAVLRSGKWHSVGVSSMIGYVLDLVWVDDNMYLGGPISMLNDDRDIGFPRFDGEHWQLGEVNKTIIEPRVCKTDGTVIASGQMLGQDGIMDNKAYVLEEGQWEEIPGATELEGRITSALRHEGRYYFSAGDLVLVDDGSQTETFSLSGSQWGLVSRLFHHPDGVGLHTGYGLYTISEPGSPSLIMTDIVDERDYEAIVIVKAKGADIWVGGSFVNAATESTGLIRVRNGVQDAGCQVSSNNSHRAAWYWAGGYTVTKYRGNYVIGGRFVYADGVYSPNIVQWTGEEFIPFENTLGVTVNQLEVFEDELYAIARGAGEVDPSLAGYGLLKYDGSTWVGIETPYRCRSISVAGDKLFINDRVDYISSSNFPSSGDGPPAYLKDGEWHYLPDYNVTSNVPFYRYHSVQGYKDGYAMFVRDFLDQILVYLASDTSEWVVMDTIDQSINVDRFVVSGEDKYLIDEWPQRVYSVEDGNVKPLISDVEVDNAYFFSIAGEDYFSAFNGKTHRLVDGDRFELHNSLRVLDSEKLTDTSALVIMQGSRYQLNQEVIDATIGIWRETPLEADISATNESICAGTWAEFALETQHLGTTVEWEMEGGTPAVSSSLVPMVKYEEAGDFLVNMVAIDNTGDSLQKSTEITVEECEIAADRSDNYDNHLILGYHYGGDGLGGFDFTLEDSVQSPIYDTPVEMNSGAVTMSDKDGKLQFYTNGVSILNRNNQPLLGSDCFNASLSDYPLDYFISPQSLVSLPVPDTDSLYFVIDLDPMSIDGQYWLAGSNLAITKVDMSLAGGLGGVVECNTEIITDTLLFSTMNATKHANGLDWWIVVGKYNSNQYYSLLLTQEGVQQVTVHEWEVAYTATVRGQSAFSPDGNYFAQIIEENQEVNLWRFDTDEGKMYNHQVYSIATVDDIENPRGCSFSPNSRFLYVSSLTQLRQIDLCSYDNLDMVLLDEFDGAIEFIYPLYYSRQLLAPDQQIVIAPNGNSHFSYTAIRKPNVKGKNCQVVQQGLQINANTRSLAAVMPYVPHFRTYASYDGECTTSTIAQEEDGQAIYVFPNPSLQGTVLHLNQSSSGTIINSMGQVVHSFSNSDYLDMLTLPRGTYHIVTEHGTTSFIRI